MSQRTGSSWESDILTSHDQISMAGEIFNHVESESAAERICNFFSKSVGNPGHYTTSRAFASHYTSMSVLSPARGFKQKFLYCGGRLRTAMCEEPDG